LIFINWRQGVRFRTEGNPAGKREPGFINSLQNPIAHRLNESLRLAAAPIYLAVVVVIA